MNILNCGVKHCNSKIIPCVLRLHLLIISPPPRIFVDYWTLFLTGVSIFGWWINLSTTAYMIMSCDLGHVSQNLKLQLMHT